MRRLVLAVLATVAGAVALTVPATAQQAPPPTTLLPPLVPTDALIPVVEPFQPVLEIVSPVVWPQCADAVLVTVLPGALGVDVPPEVAIATGPLLILCGSVPVPDSAKRACALDAQAADLLAQLTIPLAGTALPVEVAPERWVTGLLDNIVDEIPAAEIPIGSSVTATLQCTDPGPAAPTTTGAPAPTATTAAPAADAPSAAPPAPRPVSFANPPTFASLQTLPRVVATPGATAPEAATPVVAAPDLTLIGYPRFRYPILMGLPLAFIALVAFFGRALTRPLEGARP